MDDADYARSASLPPVTGSVGVGEDCERLDAQAKVTGAARYAAEFPAADMVHAVVVNASIAAGRITALQVDEALQVAGVIDVLTHLHRPKVRRLAAFYKDMVSPGGSPFKPLSDERVHYNGQPVAVVLADSFEAARHAASLVRVDYAVEPHETDTLAHASRARQPKRLKLGYSPPPKPRGDPDAAYAAAALKVDCICIAGMEHHNPMELHATTVIPDEDGHLTVYDKTQGSQNTRSMLSRVFGLKKEKLTVVNRYVGGAFGSGLRPQYNVILAVMACLHLKRPVRLVLTRQQMFTLGYRPETWQRVRLAASADGRLSALMHEVVAQTSRLEDYTEVVANWSGRLYHCDNVRMDHRIVDLDVYSPMDMRAPGAAHGVHAIEVAMDELSYVVGMDPLELRIRNYTDHDPVENLPWSSKELMACYRQGATAFGWDQRPRAVRSRKEGHEWVGWGMASGQWDAMQMFARARAVLQADGSLDIETAASDIGTGTWTVITQIAAAAMGLPLERVRLRMGDSRLPVAPVEGGSAHVATIGSAVDGVCEKLMKRLLKLASTLPDSPWRGRKISEVECKAGALRLKRNPGISLPFTQLLADTGKSQVEEKYLMLPNMLKQRKYSRAVHSAVFVEVRVDEDFGTVRVTRVVSAVAAGRIINPRTARSQVLGGVVWGISQALHEESQRDHRLGRIMNHSFAEYHIAANADVHDIDVLFVPETDTVVSRIGAKGVGEIGIVGVAAAISNAIYHATGRRVSDTPITPDKVMRAETMSR